MPDQYPRAGFPWDAGWSTSHATGAFVPVELGYLTAPERVRHPTKFDIGFTYDSSNFADPRYNSAGLNLTRLNSGAPAGDGAITTIYAQAQKVVWRPGPAKLQDLTVFGGLQINTSGHALVQNYFMAGAVLHGTFPGRPNDTVGVLAQTYLFNHCQTGHLDNVIAAEGLTGHVSNTEQEIEVNHGLEVAPGIQFKPYANYAFHPDQNLFDVTPNPRVRYALGAGVQLSILLNQVTGLLSFFRANWRRSLAELNALNQPGFSAALDEVFERSPWVAALVWTRRPFASLGALHGAMVKTAETVGEGAQLGLLRAHPELAQPGSLTAASRGEQGGMGFDALEEDEVTRFAATNQLCRERFGFPFIVAVRGQRDRAAILGAMEKRLGNAPDVERRRAFAEVARIARFRLQNLLGEDELG